MINFNYDQIPALRKLLDAVTKFIDEQNNDSKKDPSVQTPRVACGCFSDECSTVAVAWGGNIVSIHNLRFDQHPIKI